MENENNYFPCLFSSPSHSTFQNSNAHTPEGIKSTKIPLDLPSSNSSRTPFSSSLNSSMTSSYANEYHTRNTTTPSSSSKMNISHSKSYAPQASPPPTVRYISNIHDNDEEFFNMISSK